MARKIYAIFTTLLVMIVFAACSQDEQSFTGAYKAPEKDEGITVRVLPQDSLHTDLVDKDGVPVVRFLEWRGAEVKTQPTQYADATEPWQPGQQLIREQLPVQAESQFTFNHGVNTIGTRVKFVVTESKVYNLEDGRKVVLTKGQELELYKPERLNLKGSEPTTEVREGRLYYAETAVTYSLRYEDRVLAEGIQYFVAEEGYKPSFEALEWGANHIKGTAKASYDPSKANIIVTCTDTLWAKEKWDNGEYKNVLSTYTHSKQSYGLQISGTDNVSSISAIVGNDMNVSGNKATIAEVTLTLTEVLNEIVEKSVPYTYNSKGINFVDSLHACSYKLYGAKYTTSSNVHVTLVRKSDSEKVSVDVNKPLTEKVTILRTEPVFSHVRYITNPAPQGNNVAIVSYDKVTVINYMSNNTQETVGATEYPVTKNYTVSYTSNIQVDDLLSFCGRYNLVNGAVTVQGYNFSTNLVSTVYGDAIVDGKNYKNKAPECPLNPIALTISTNSLVYEYQGSHEGHNDIIKVTFPLTVTEKPHTPDYPGRTVWCGVVDAYTDGANVATWESARLISISFYNGEYRLYHRNVNSNSWVDPNGVVVSAAYALSINNNRPAAMIGNTADAYTHGSCQWADQGSWCKIMYFDANGGVARIISEISKTIGGESSNNCRMPLRGTWNNGKVVADGVTYVVKGSED